MIKPGFQLTTKHSKSTLYEKDFESIFININQILYFNYFESLDELTTHNIYCYLFHLNKFSVRYGYNND